MGTEHNPVNVGAHWRWPHEYVGGNGPSWKVIGPQRGPSPNTQWFKAHYWLMIRYKLYGTDYGPSYIPGHKTSCPTPSASWPVLPTPAHSPAPPLQQSFAGKFHSDIPGKEFPSATLPIMEISENASLNLFAISMSYCRGRGSLRCLSDTCLWVWKGGVSSFVSRIHLYNEGPLFLSTTLSYSRSPSLHTQPHPTHGYLSYQSVMAPGEIVSPTVIDTSTASWLDLFGIRGKMLDKHAAPPPPLARGVTSGDPPGMATAEPLVWVSKVLRWS